MTTDLELRRNPRLLVGVSFALRHPLRFLRALAITVYHQPIDGLLVLLRSICAAELVLERFDHIHSHFARRACKHALILSILTGITYSFTTHIPQHLPGYFEPPKDLYLRVKHATRVITTTGYNQKYLERQFRIPSNKIAVVPPSIDTTKFRPGERTHDRRIVLNVSRLHSLKDHRTLLQACLYLKDLDVHFECKIIGEGPEREDLQGLVKRLGLSSQVCLLGVKTTAEVIEYYHEASVFVMPSLFEGLGVAAMEAMACEVPVVATRVGGVPELVEDGRTGFLVEVGDYQELGNKIALLLEDNQLRTSMGREARRKVIKSYDINQNVKRLAEILECP